MNDRGRIEALATDGRITRDEADRLLQVLDDMDGAERQMNGVAAEVEGAGTAAIGTRGEPTGVGETAPGETAAGDATPGDALPGNTAPGESAPGNATPGDAADGLQLVEVELLAGDLEIEVKEDLRTPTASGNGQGEIALEQTARGYRLRGTMGDDSTFLGRLVGRISGGSVRLSIPRGWGVRLDMKAGDVTVRGPLAFLGGHLFAGDIDAAELLGVDLTLKAGDIDLGVRIREGRHKVQAVAGDVRIRLLADSNVTVRGRVSIGDLTVPSEWGGGGRGLGSRIEHTLGEGSGSLELALGAGDLKIGCAHE